METWASDIAVLQINAMTLFYGLSFCKPACACACACMSYVYIIDKDTLKENKDRSGQQKFDQETYRHERNLP